MTSIVLSFADNTSPPLVLHDVIVRIYNQAGDQFITQLVSDENGEITYDIPDGTYWVRMYKKGYSFQSKALIEVTAGLYNQWLIVGNNLTELPPSSAAGICRVSGFVVDAQGAPSHLPIITFALPSEIRVMGGNLLGTEKVICQPDANGYVEVELIQNATYSVTMASISDEVLEAKVPPEQACNITDLLYPRGITTPLPSSLTITADTKTSTGVTVLASSRLPLPDTDIGLSATSLISVQADTSISTVVESGTLYVTGTTPGTYSVEVYSEYAYKNVNVSPILIGTISVTVNA